MDIVSPRFEDSILLIQYFVMKVVKVYVRYELRVDLPVTIFFPTEDWLTSPTSFWFALYRNQVVSSDISLKVI